MPSDLRPPVSSSTSKGVASLLVGKPLNALCPVALFRAHPVQRPNGARLESAYSGDGRGSGHYIWHSGATNREKPVPPDGILEHTLTIMVS